MTRRGIAPVLKDGFRIIINPRTQRATTLDNIIPLVGVVKVQVHTEVSNIFSDRNFPGAVPCHYLKKC